MSGLIKVLKVRKLFYLGAVELYPDSDACKSQKLRPGSQSREGEQLVTVTTGISSEDVSAPELSSHSAVRGTTLSHRVCVGVCWGG